MIITNIFSPAFLCSILVSPSLYERGTTIYIGKGGWENFGSRLISSRLVFIFCEAISSFLSRIGERYLKTLALKRYTIWKISPIPNWNGEVFVAASLMMFEH